MQKVHLTIGVCISLIAILSEADAQYRRAISKRRWKYEATLSGYIYASRYFRHRYRPNMNPTICLNFHDKPPELNDTFPNGTRIYSATRTTYRNFICPLTSQLGTSYCCGPITRQVCCSFWQDAGRAIGGSFGIVMGIILGIWIVHMLFKSFHGSCPRLKRCSNGCRKNITRCCCRLCRLRPNDVNQGPSTSEATSPPPPSSSPSPAASEAPDGADVEPKPLPVAPLAPPSYSSLNLRERDLFGDSLSAELPPPPTYASIVRVAPEGAEGTQP